MLWPSSRASSSVSAVRRAALDAVAASGKPVVIDLSDSLQAHNLVAVGMDEGTARAVPSERGANWIKRNGAAVAAYGGEILRWERWRGDPEFKSVHGALVGL
jgi:hypothetical protein